MGLDMYLTARKFISASGYRSEPSKKEFDQICNLCGIEPDSSSKTGHIAITIGYWRKANAIHAWFVKNVQDGVDDCKEAQVTKEQLQDLIKICREALDSRDPNVLKTQDGFFFGSTDADEWYWNSIEDTIDIAEKAIRLLSEQRDVDIIYQSSW